MADGLVGWHPDPGGARGRFRYWDGTRWSAETTDDPGRASQPPARPRRSRGPLIASVIAGLAVVVLLGFAVRSLVLAAGPVDINPSPPPTVLGDDSSATPTPTATPSPTRSPLPRSPTASPRSGAPLVPCPLGLPNQRQPHPVDGRVHGGNLSFPAEPTFRPANEEPRMVFAHDVIQQQLPVSSAPGWIAQLAVGRLRAADGFVNDPRNTAESLAQCIVSGTMYDPYDPTRTDLHSEEITISGRGGWLIEAEVTVATPGLAFPGDRAVFVVVPDGADWGFFFGATPLGDARLSQVLDRTVTALEVS